MKNDGDLRGEGTKDADCHDQFANWSRNDTLQGMRCKSGGRTEASAPMEVLLVVRRGGALPLPRATARVAPTEGLPIGFRRGRCPHCPGGTSFHVMCRAGRGHPPLHYIMLLCGAWGRGCKRPFARQQGGGAPRPADGIFVSYLFRSSKFSAVTMDWILVHRGAKVLARSS